MEDSTAQHFTDEQKAGLRRADSGLVAGFLALSIGIGSVAIGTGLAALAKRVFLKTPFPDSFNQMFSGIDKWILGGAALIAAIPSYLGLKSLFVNNQSHIYENINLRNDNIAMRSQLNQTGQILQHVAKQVEQGTLKDSELSVSDEAPAGHVAKHAAEKGERELEKALNHVANASKHTSHSAHAQKHETHSSHAARAAEQKAEAAEAAHTVH